MVIETPLEVNRGLLLGIALGPFEAAGFLVNPGGDDRFGIVSVGVGF
jgi:hypothetical protein